MKIARTAVAFLLMAGLQTGVHAQERTKDRPKQESREVKPEADRNREKDKDGKATEKRDNAQGKSKSGTLKPVDRHEKEENKSLHGKGADEQHKHKHKDGRAHDHGDGNDHDHGKGNAYGKHKDGMEGKEFGQHRAQEARSRQQLTTTVNDHEQKIVLSRLKIKEATERLEEERKSGKLSTELYRERKERIAKAEQGVLDLERRLIEAKHLK